MNEPSDESTTAPWIGSVTFIAVRESPSVSVSLASTPGAATTTAVFSGVLWLSSTATGTAL